MGQGQEDQIQAVQLGRLGGRVGERGRRRPATGCGRPPTPPGARRRWPPPPRGRGGRRTAGAAPRRHTPTHRRHPPSWLRSWCALVGSGPARSSTASICISSHAYANARDPPGPGPAAAGPTGRRPTPFRSTAGVSGGETTRPGGLGSGRESRRRPGRGHTGLLLAGRSGGPALRTDPGGSDRRRSHRRGRRLHGSVDSATGQDGPAPSRRAPPRRRPLRMGGVGSERRLLRRQSHPRAEQRRRALPRRDRHPGAPRRREPGRNRGDHPPMVDRMRVRAHRASCRWPQRPIRWRGWSKRPTWGGGTDSGSPCWTGTRCGPRCTPPPIWPDSGTTTVAPW